MFKAEEICEECKAELVWTTFSGNRVCFDCEEFLREEAENRLREED